MIILLVLTVGFSGYIYFDSSRRIGDLTSQVSSLTSSVQGLSTSLSSSNSQIAQLSQAVSALSQGSSGSTGGGTTDVSALYDSVKDSVVLIKSTLPLGTATGSGFIYDTQGRIVTNNHVIDGANSITVTFINGTIVSATVVGADPYSDIAVIQVSAPAALLKPLRLGDSSVLKVGQEVLAIGNPYGLADTLTTGIISATGREMDSASGYPIVDVIQTDAAINPGNSGGPLLNLSGEVVGINTAIPSQTSSGIGFAVPSNTISREIASLISTGKYDQVYIGIQGTDVTPEIVTTMNLPAGTHGVLLTTVSGPAVTAGLRGGTSYQIVDGVYTPVGGDVITKADGQAMKGIYDLILYMQRNKRPGDMIALTIIRGGTEMAVSVTLGVRTG
jgi:S1-C subfamily serine protease